MLASDKRKSVPFHKSEKVDEEVCLSIHQLQLIFLLLSAIQASLTSESQGFSWITLLFQTIFLSYLLPALTLHSYYHLPMPCCGQVLGPLLPSVSFWQAVLSSCHRPFQPQPSLCFQHAEMLSSTAESVYSQKQPIPSVSAEEYKSSLALVPLPLHSAVSCSLALLWMFSPSLFL